jgi:hypothetical protein
VQINPLDNERYADVRWTGIQRVHAKARFTFSCGCSYGCLAAKGAQNGVAGKAL